MHNINNIEPKWIKAIVEDNFQRVENVIFTGEYGVGEGIQCIVFKNIAAREACIKKVLDDYHFRDLTDEGAAS